MRAFFPRMLLALCVFAGIESSGLCQSAPAQNANEPLRTAGEVPVDVHNLRLNLIVDLPGKKVDSRATLSVTTKRALDSITLDAEGFTVKKVQLVGVKGRKEQEIPFRHDGHQLILTIEPPLPSGASADLVIDYLVREPKYGLHFFGPSKTDPDVPLTCWSHGEPLYNRAWIPCFDRPGIRQSSELIVMVPEGNEVLSNGKLISKTRDEATKTVTFHWKQTDPHPSYLISLVVGPFAVIETKWRDKPVYYYVPPARKGDAQRTFGRTPEMMEVFSRKFGVDYPWDKYSQVVVEQFVAGGQENTSATTLTNCLLDERMALDRDADSLISHELGHQWWGDLVTCRDWAHIWLNEGFASYCECIWLEHHNGKDDYSLDVMNKKAAALGAVDRPVIDRRYPTPETMFDSRAYPKGAFILHMLRQKVGDEVFFAGLKKYLTDNRLNSVETVFFRRAMEQVSGRDLERFFYDWTERSGNPKLEVNSSYDAESKRVRVSLKQTQAGEPFHFPLKIRLHSSFLGAPVDFEELITSKEQTIQIPVTLRPTLLEIDPEQAVLAEIKEEKGRDWWAEQLVAGSTAASRTYAARHFGASKSDPDREAMIAALAKEMHAGVAAQIMTELGKSGGVLCRDALLKEYESPDNKRRIAASVALRGFPKDEKIAAAALVTLTRGDPSISVETGALSIYAKQKRPDAVKVIAPWLEKPTTDFRTQVAVLGALASLEDPAALEPLMAWCKPGKPTDARAFALNSLARFVKTAKLSDAQRDEAVQTIAESLTGQGLRIRRSAVSALQTIGVGAKAALKTLDEVAANDPVESVAEAAKKAAAEIRGSSTENQDAKKLREELERLKKEQEELRRRLEKFEKLDKKGPGLSR